MAKRFEPRKDGADHINVYSQGKTSLGRFLSNFALSPIETEDGTFKSIEGYWYWLGAGNHPSKDRLRDLVGAEAKEYGQFIGASDWCEDAEFKRKILAAITLKLDANPIMKTELQKTRLPLAHYYVYGDKVVNVKGAQWLLDFLDSFRA